MCGGVVANIVGIKIRFTSNYIVKKKGGKQWEMDIYYQWTSSKCLCTEITLLYCEADTKTTVQHKEINTYPKET